MTGEELLTEHPDNIFVKGMALYTDEDGDVIKVRILPEYQDYADIFSQDNINTLPEHTKYDHLIDLIPDAKLPDGPIHPLSKKELDPLCEYIREMEDHGKIRGSFRQYALLFCLCRSLMVRCCYVLITEGGTRLLLRTSICCP